MKKLLFLFLPLSIFCQDIDNENIKIKYLDNIDSLIIKNQNTNNGINGWRVQLAFKSTKEEIRSSRINFINKYPGIPSYLTFSSPYYRICVGNFRTKLEALKLKDKIKKEYIEAYPVLTIIPLSELRIKD